MQDLPIGQSSYGRSTRPSRRSLHIEMLYGVWPLFLILALHLVLMTGTSLYTPRSRSKLTAVKYSEIHVWTLGGDIVYTLSGHTSFVYSLSVLPSGDIVSAGEDRTVRLWKGLSYFDLIDQILVPIETYRWRIVPNHRASSYIRVGSFHSAEWRYC